MSERPKIKIPLQTSDKILEVMGYVALVGFWIFVSYAYSVMPETIPTHFNFAGEADGFGDKDTIFLMPIIGTLLFTVLSVLQQRPHSFNYITDITPENAQKQYTTAVRMIRFLKVALIVIFIFIEVLTYKTAMGGGEDMGIWLLPMTFLLTFGPLFYFLIKSSK